jgi:hypothetical protein
MTTTRRTWEGRDPSCIDDAELLVATVDDGLVDHLAACAACRAKRADYLQIKSALVRLPVVRPPPGWQARLNVCLDNVDRRRRRGLFLVPEHARTATRHSWLEVGVFAAALLAAVLLFGIAGGVRITGRPPSLWTLTSFGALLVSVSVSWFVIRWDLLRKRMSDGILAAVAVGVPLLLFSW